MKPVDQLRIDDVNGDCLRACVASVCELPPEDVPNFSEKGFMAGLEEWGRQQGHKVIWLNLPSETSLDKIWFGSVPDYFIVWGESPRPKADGTAKQHAVVAKGKGYGVEVIHDPHPSRDGLKSICGFCFIV